MRHSEACVGSAHLPHWALYVRLRFHVHIGVSARSCAEMPTDIIVPALVDVLSDAVTVHGPRGGCTPSNVSLETDPRDGDSGGGRQLATVEHGALSS